LFEKYAESPHCWNRRGIQSLLVAKKKEKKEEKRKRKEGEKELECVANSQRFLMISYRIYLNIRHSLFSDHRDAARTR